MDKCRLCFAQDNTKSLCDMFMKSWVILGFDGHTVCSKHNIGDGDATIGSTMCFIMCDVWLNLGIIQHAYTSSTTIAHYGARLLWNLTH
jgi:hypothetical protein